MGLHTARRAAMTPDRPAEGDPAMAKRAAASASRAADGAAWRAIPRGIWALGFVSLLMDVSSEMIHALLPVFLVVGLGTSVLAVGIIEGIAEVDRSDHQGLLRRAVRLAGQAQAARGPRLWPRRLHQAALPAGALGRMAHRRALHRPRRQGHPRCAARRPGRRPRPPTCAARASVCASRSTRSAPSSVRSWRSG